MSYSILTGPCWKHRGFRYIGGLLLTALLPASLYAEGGTILEMRLIDVSDSPGWLEEDLGKLRYGENDGPVELSQAMFHLDTGVTDTLQFRGVASYDTRRDDELDVIESYLHWRPIPVGRFRHRLNVGIFYPPFSEENRDKAWLSPYGYSNSAINAWIGEEVRTVGLQYSLERPGMFHRSPHDLTLNAAAFVGNDPTGTLLAWRGWSVHGRQSGVYERLPLPALPSFESGGAFEHQAQWLEPFREIDNRIGYYLGGEWDYTDRARFHLHYYDNRGDPTAFEVRGQGYYSSDSAVQYAWDTRFWHAGWRFRLPGRLNLFGQWMSGQTTMGAGNSLVDAKFAAAYLMLSRAFGDHRFSLRLDDFRVRDRAPGTPQDNTNESGHAWMLAWRWQITGNWQLGAEWLSVDNRRPARSTYFGEPAERTESLLQLGVQWRF